MQSSHWDTVILPLLWSKTYVDNFNAVKVFYMDILSKNTLVKLMNWIHNTIKHSWGKTSDRKKLFWEWNLELYVVLYGFNEKLLWSKFETHPSQCAKLQPFTIWFCGLPWTLGEKKLLHGYNVFDCFVHFSFYSALFNELVTGSNNVRFRCAGACFESGLHWIYM